MRSHRNLLDRPHDERRWIVENTWCDACGEADLGMSAPQEYEEDGGIYVDGTCKRCGRMVRSEITEKDAGSHAAAADARRVRVSGKTLRDR